MQMIHMQYNVGAHKARRWRRPVLGGLLGLLAIANGGCTIGCYLLAWREIRPGLLNSTAEDVKIHYHGGAERGDESCIVDLPPGGSFAAARLTMYRTERERYPIATVEYHDQTCSLLFEDESVFEIVLEDGLLTARKQR